MDQLVGSIKMPYRDQEVSGPPSVEVEFMGHYASKFGLYPWRFCLPFLACEASFDRTRLDEISPTLTGKCWLLFLSYRQASGQTGSTKPQALEGKTMVGTR